jgi:hypothetical protein
VELVNGGKGEFTVSLDDRVIAQKGDSLPPIEEVVGKVHNAAPAGAGA